MKKTTIVFARSVTTHGYKIIIKCRSSLIIDLATGLHPPKLIRVVGNLIMKPSFPLVRPKKYLRTLILK